MPVVVQAIVVDEGLLDLFHRRACRLICLDGRSDDEECVHVDIVLARMSRWGRKRWLKNQRETSRIREFDVLSQRLLYMLSTSDRRIRRGPGRGVAGQARETVTRQ